MISHVLPISLTLKGLPTALSPGDLNDQDAADPTRQFLARSRNVVNGRLSSSKIASRSPTRIVQAPPTPITPHGKPPRPGRSGQLQRAIHTLLLRTEGLDIVAKGMSKAH
jgi:hypothetical protein